MSKRETKISLFGSAENENISIVIDEDSKMINILRQNANRAYQEIYRLDSVNIGGKESEIKMELKDDNLTIKNKNNSGVTIDANGVIKVNEDKK